MKWQKSRLWLLLYVLNYGGQKTTYVVFWVPRSFWGTKNHRNIQFLLKKQNFYVKIFIGAKLSFIDFFMIFRQNLAIFEGKKSSKNAKIIFFQIPSETISRKSVLTIARL